MAGVYAEGGTTCQQCNESSGWREEGVEDFFCHYCPTGKFLPSQDYDPAVNQEGNCITDCSAIPSAAPGAFFDGTYAQCVDPVPGYVASPTGGFAKCEIGHVPDKDTGECTKCEGNSFARPGWPECVECKGSFHADPTNGGCLPDVDPATVECAEGTHPVPEPQDYDGIIKSVFRNSNIHSCSELHARAGQGYLTVYDRLCAGTMVEFGYPPNDLEYPWGTDDDIGLAYIWGNIALRATPQDAETVAKLTSCPDYLEAELGDFGGCHDSVKWLPADKETTKTGWVYENAPYATGGQGWDIFAWILTGGTGLVTPEETIASGEGFWHFNRMHHIISSYSPCSQNRYCGADALDYYPKHCDLDGHTIVRKGLTRECLVTPKEGVPQWPGSCATAAHLCNSPIVAIYCPQTCGIFPHFQIMEGQPYYKLSTRDDPQPGEGAPERYRAWNYDTLPIRPPSMWGCPTEHYGGKWNHETGMLDPHCAVEVPKCMEDAACKSSDECNGGVCVMGHRRLLFASRPAPRGHCSCTVRR
jgi:hypothetical protein